MKQPYKKIVPAIAVILLAGAAWAWHRSSGNQSGVFYQTAEVTRGDLTVSISATGTIEPEEVVDVGAQVAGKILSFGKDVRGNPVDYGSVVAKGTVLALIDDSVYATDVTTAEAQEQSARASVMSSEADLVQSKAKLNQAERDWRRAEKIGPSEALSQTSYDGYLSAYEIAKAGVAIGQAAILQAKAGLAQTRAAMERTKRNIGYCTITSPVDGIIIDRRVNIGQTVVASLNAPSLFLIAKDLTRMQVWVAVNEADIGKIRPGQPVTFTVDAFPGETFQGTVRKPRLNASMTQNVVTYTVEIETENKDGKLLPYLTANVRFELASSKNMLRVPNTALTFTPRTDQIVPEFRNTNQQSDPAAQAASLKRRNTGAASGQGDRKRMWITDGSYVRPIRVKVGESDGSLTAVEGEELAEGLKVVTNATTQMPATAATGTKSPFMPQFPGRGGPPR